MLGYWVELSLERNAGCMRLYEGLMFYRWDHTFIPILTAQQASNTILTIWEWYTDFPY